jgi:archaellum component FlaC
MKRLLFIALLGAGLTGCQNNNEPNPEVEKMRVQRDSIAREASARDSTINSFMESMNEIEDNLREVRQRQGNITTTAKSDRELQGTAKERITEDINTINELMEENKQKLASLQSKLKKSSVKLGQFEKTIERMTAQLTEKDTEITTLKEQLASMNIQITELNTSVTNLQTESASKTAMIDQQTTRLNTAFYAVGTYKELRDNKVVNKEGGFLGLGKKKILKSDFNQDYFTTIDVTQVTTIPVNAKNAKVITNHPASSYKVDLDGKKMARSITITNPDAFWRSSKYLVVTVEK